MAKEQHAITVQNLTKKFKDTVAVKDISFSVQKGSLFAFLGTNGAGKSTTINILTGILTPTAGIVSINGQDVGAQQAEIGVVFQQSLLDPILTVRENLKSRAAMYGITDASGRIEELAALIQLNDFIDRRYDALSGGQKRRADIARALVHSPSLLFLDEPTAGLDPKSREAVWHTISELRKKTHLTVFLTTHYMEETERADLVYIIDKGSIATSGTPSQLRAEFSSSVLTLTPGDTKRVEACLHTRGVEYTTFGQDIRIAVASHTEALSLLDEVKESIETFEYRHGSMDDVFLSLTETHEGDV